MPINTKNILKKLRFHPAHLVLGMVLFVGVGFAVYQNQFGANAQGGGTLTYQAFLWIKNGLQVQYPGQNILYDSLFGSWYLYSASDASMQNNYHRVTVVPNAHADANASTGYVFDAPRATEFQNAALVADQHIDIPLVSGAPIKENHYYKVKFKFRAGPNGGDNGTDPAKKWDTDGGFTNRGTFAASILTDGNVNNSNGAMEYIADSQFGVTPDDFRGNPLRSTFTTGYNQTFNTHGDPRCYQTPSEANPQNSWCTWESGIWKMQGRILGNGTTAPFQSEDNQALILRSGSTLDDSWFVGEMQLDDIEVYETDASGAPLSSNLVRDPAKNASFDDAAGPAGITSSVSQAPASDYLSYSRKTENVPNGSGGTTSNGFLSYVSTNYFIIAANPNDSKSYPLYLKYPSHWCAKDATNNQRFFQSIDPNVPCYSADTSRLAPQTAVYDEKITSELTASSIYVKTKIVDTVCTDSAFDPLKVNNQVPIHMFTQLTHYKDTHVNGYFDGFGNGLDTKISQLTTTSSGDQSVLNHVDSSEVDCSNPSFVIRAEQPSATCAVDSFYTGSPQVSLDFANAGSFNEFRVQKASGAWGPWRLLNSVQQCTANASVRSVSQNLFNDIEILDHTPGVKSVGVQFGTQVGANDVEGPVLFDTILYGYPYLSTFRGDVHSNGDILGEATSNGLSAVQQFSHFTCNPPSPGGNADYVISALGNLQSISGSCQQATGSSADTFQTSNQSSLSKLTGSDAKGLENALSDFSVAQLESAASVVCESGSVTSNGTVVNGVGCVQHPENSTDFGKILFFRGDVSLVSGTPTNPGSITFDNAPTGSSGAVTIATLGSVDVQTNVAYGNGSAAVSSTRQLASLAVLAQQDIRIANSISSLAGIYLAKGNLSTSQDPTDKKLSLYGSLIANHIDFNRNWLGLE